MFILPKKAESAVLDMALRGSAVGGSPIKGVITLYVTYEGLFEFCLLIVGVISLVCGFYNSDKK